MNHMKTKETTITILIIIILFVALALVLGLKISTPFKPKTEDHQIVCTADARQCSDGSFVGRIPPDCQFAECPRPDLSATGEELLSNSWVWRQTDYGNEETIVPPTEDFVLSFDLSEGLVMSTTDCNSLSGSFVINNETISFSPFASTLMYCENSLETEYQQTLSSASSYSIEENRLTIRTLEDQTVMIFEKL